MKAKALFTVIVSAACLAQALEFTQSPSIVRDTGSSWRIEFAVDESTDVEVSIVNAATKGCVRHLAAGVLGGNAPAPLLRNSLSQVVFWDGLDDCRAPAVSPESLTVRVRAGMGIRQDGFAGGDPYECSSVDRGAMPMGGMVQGSDGSVFIAFRPSGVSPQVVRQYSATGEYRRTLFPIPGGKPVDDYAGWGLNLLSSTDYSPKTQDYLGPLMTNSPLGTTGNSGKWTSRTTLLMAGPTQGQLGIIGRGTNEIWALNEDGASDAALAASNTAFLNVPNAVTEMYYSQGAFFTAVAPDRSYFLLSSFYNSAATATDFLRDGRLYKVDMATRVPAVLFDLDSLIPAASRPTVLGSSFRSELSGVALGDSGRIFLCDRLNNRLLVLDSAGRLLKIFAVKCPDNVAYCASTGALYITRMDNTEGYFLVKITDWRTDTAVTASKVLKAGQGPSDDINYAGWGGPNATYIAATPSDEGVLIWLAAQIGGVVIYRDSADTFAEYKNFRKLSNQRFAVIKRLAVDSKTETAYLVGSGTGVYKVADWNNPRFSPCSTKSGSTKTPLNGYDLAVDPVNRHLFVRESGGSPWKGPINRYALDSALYAPAPLSVMNRYNMADSFSVTGTTTPGTADMGICVSSNGHLAALALKDYGFLASGYAVNYYPVYDTQTVSRRLTVGSVGTAIPWVCGGVKFDLQGNIYFGQRPVSPPAGLPSVIIGDLSFSQTTGSIYRFDMNGSPDGDLFTTAKTAPDKVYRVDFGALGNSNDGSHCVCMNATFGMDGWGRLYAPNGPFQKITVLDNEGNRCLRFGSYGNFDNVVQEHDGIAGTSGKCYMAYPFCVEATDDYVYATDPANVMLTRFQKTFILDNVPSMSPVVALPVRTAAALALSAYPNPFTAQGRISVALPAASSLTLEVVDMRGRVVERVATGAFGAGTHAFAATGRMASGVYFLRLKAGKGALTRRIVVTR